MSQRSTQRQTVLNRYLLTNYITRMVRRLTTFYRWEFIVIESANSEIHERQRHKLSWTDLLTYHLFSQFVLHKQILLSSPMWMLNGIGESSSIVWSLSLLLLDAFNLKENLGDIIPIATTQVRWLVPYNIVWMNPSSMKSLFLKIDKPWRTLYFVNTYFGCFLCNAIFPCNMYILTYYIFMLHIEISHLVQAKRKVCTTNLTLKLLFVTTNMHSLTNLFRVIDNIYSFRSGFTLILHLSSSHVS